MDNDLTCNQRRNEEAFQDSEFVTGSTDIDLSSQCSVRNSTDGIGVVNPRKHSYNKELSKQSTSSATRGVKRILVKPYRISDSGVGGKTI